MNSGNLAEDPRAGLSSSSRYSRNGGEKNSLLYVDSSSLRKERKAAERRAGSQASAIKGNHNSRKNKSVGRVLTDSHMDRLEVGSDGRLFQVKESQTPSNSSSTSTPEHSDISNTTGSNPVQVRPAILEGAVSDAEKAPAKPERDYLTKTNPLFAKPKRQHRKAAAPAAEAEENSAAGKAEVSSAAGKAETNIEVGKAEENAAAGKAEESAAAGTLARQFVHRFRIPLIVSAAVLATAGYSYAAWHYSNRFYPGTEFFGISAAEQSVYDVKAAVKEKVDSYCLQLVARTPGKDDSATDAASVRTSFSGNESNPAKENIITAEDVAMIYRDNGEIDSAMKNQKSWAWPVMMLARLFGEGDLSLETSYDESLVPEALSRLDCMQKKNMIRPQNAHIILTDNGAQVQTEIYGTTLNTKKTEEEVRKALDQGTTMIDLDALGLYRYPRITSGDLSLTAEAMAMNKVLGAKVLLRIGNRTEVINSEVIASFLDKKGSYYVLNEEKVRAYVSDLAKKYDTFQCERDFYTSIGTKITLEAGIGDYGWLMDQEATYEKILEAIREQKKMTIEPVYTQTAYCRDANDIGDTYVEISLTNQMMWFYKNGKLVVETPVVTGNPYAGHETPSGGVWSLKGKMRNQTLVGQGYASPVDYWMPFNNGVGIHDMQSRAWFGGSIYLGSGSHGCVNTPLAAVKLIYDQIEEGVPVIVYKDESEEAYAQITGPTDSQTLKAQIEENYGTVEDDGIGSIVSWSRSQRAQAAAAAAQAASSGTSAS